MMKTIATNLSLIAIVALASSAAAQDRSQPHDLYANRDGKAFSFERSFPSLAACDSAAKSLYESKRVLGAGCKPSTTTPPSGAPNRAAEAEDPKAGTRERPR
jgi:hypothetical protein